MTLEKAETTIKTKEEKLTGNAGKNSEKGEPRPDVNSLWRAVQAHLQLNLSEYTYRTWVKKAEARNLTENSIEIASPNAHARDQLKNFEPLLQSSINDVGKGEYKLKFIVDTKLNGGSAKKESKNKKAEKETKQETTLFEHSKNTKSNQRNSNLASQFTFDSYIMGDNNQLAYSIALAIAKNPGSDYNPLFLYSGVGLGKTHLVQAIGNKIVKEKPNLKVLYTTGEQFANELIEAIQTGKGKTYRIDQFRKKFRSADVLIIDDIQFIVGKESTQQEFFHTFNTLHLDGRQVILTSDRPPKDFINLEERITSRFGSGITADIQQPDLEIRTAILRSRRDSNNEPVTNEVIDFIAAKVDTNIRELKGAYIQVLSEAQAKGNVATIEMAAKALGQIVVEKRESATPNDIMKAVCKYYKVNKTDIKGRRRTKKVVIPRQIAMYLLRNMTETPLVAIGELLGGRDHTTVMHGADKIADQMQEKPRTRQDVENIKSILKTM